MADPDVRTCCLDVRTILSAEVDSLSETILKMDIAIENSKLDLAAAIIIKDSIQSQLESIPEQELIQLPEK
jgi:hypothetical protein|tara:strand:- start:12027 stop:12239 length:213 start_codon:yes stop_codon:yes gene_type:complete